MTTAEIELLNPRPVTGTRIRVQVKFRADYDDSCQ